MHTVEPPSPMQGRCKAFGRNLEIEIGSPSLPWKPRTCVRQHEAQSPNLSSVIKPKMNPSSQPGASDFLHKTPNWSHGPLKLLVCRQERCCAALVRSVPNSRDLSPSGYHGISANIHIRNQGPWQIQGRNAVDVDQITQWLCKPREGAWGQCIW